MSLLDSSITPYLTILVIFAVLAGFARKTLVKVIIFLLIFTILMALFPALLVKYTELIRSIRGIF